MSIFKDYAKFYNLLYKDRPYKQEADFVYKWANKPKKILELGCGTGQHAKHWVNKVNRIVGIDNSREMLDNAYQHSKFLYFKYNIENLENFPCFSFDCIVALFNVMGYCLLENCLPWLPLKKGGYFIFDVWDASKFKIQPPQPKVKYFNYGYRVSIPERYSKRLLRIDFIINECNKIKMYERHFVEGYFYKDIQDLCKKCGYKISAVKRTKGWIIWYRLQKL